MRPEKLSILNELKQLLQQSPYLILTDFTGLNVEGFAQLRGRLAKISAKAMVVKNSLLKAALKELSLPEVDGSLQGPTAIIFGGQEITAAAKVMKNFIAESKKLKNLRIKGGVMDRAPLAAAEVAVLADLPSREALRAQLLGLLMAPASRFVRLMNTPASQLVQVMQAKAQKAA